VVAAALANEEFRAAQVPLIPAEQLRVGYADAHAPLLVRHVPRAVPGAEGALAGAHRQLLGPQARLHLRLQVSAVATGVEDRHGPLRSACGEAAVPARAAPPRLARRGSRRTTAQPGPSPWRSPPVPGRRRG